MSPIRVLLFADTHLGFDSPVRPRVQRRRRGDDFFANFERVLARASAGNFDLVVHGGDLFFRSRIPPELVQRAFLPLKRVADAGLPVFIVPGNHERSRIPYDMLARHERIHIFDRPRTFAVKLRDVVVGLSGFPYAPDVRAGLPTLVRDTAREDVAADVRLLCVHHCFEGATVGPSDYMFRYNDDVIRHRDIPTDFAAVFTGHIHRAQVLTRDLSGRKLSVPVIYPGSIERTSFAEREEEKGFFEVEIATDGSVSTTFVEVPARPMIDVKLSVDELSVKGPLVALKNVIESAPEDGILRVRITGHASATIQRSIRAEHIRSITPATMNVDVSLPDMRKPYTRTRKVSVDEGQN